MTERQTNLVWDTLVDLGKGDQPAGRSPRYPVPGGARRQPGGGPLHARLAGALRAAIRDGRLAPGTVLPPSRLLAADLGCSRWAVTEAYGQLVAEGYLDARTGSGTRVAQRGRVGADARQAVPTPRTGTSIDLAPGLPDLRHFPTHRWITAWRTAVATLPYERLGYPTDGGEPELREVLAGYLNRVRGAAVRPDDLTICTGVTDAVRRICAAARTASGGDEPGAVAVEDPGWTRLRDAITATGLPVVPVPVDRDGIRVDILHRHPQIRVAVVSPAHQFPTGVVLAPHRRAALLDWAREVDGLIVEDDYDAEFRYDRRPVGTMQGTDPDRVALAGSVSKTLTPALGLGWLATPARWTTWLRHADRTGASPPVLDQLAFATFLDSGGYDRHLRACRQRYRARRDALVAALGQALPDAVVSGAAAGLHLLVRPYATATGRTTDGPAVVERAAAAGVRIACVEQYRVRHEALDGSLVLGYGNLTDADVATAVARLATVVRLASAVRARTDGDGQAES